ncbi:type IX secretion system protein PorQ [Parasegetibacter sp. NRK P23]|uniref:type IX secretion system protein PorQ n=1 Tax=Parasegetibacter sp. NRK P23 TaxID=2942999 RepID=UPI0020A6EEAA|nr:type IX secretion system protein PorQ [Parasegetibacter sp. NRK P23]
MRWWCSILFAVCVLCLSTKAQTLGGETTFNFLKLPFSPQQSALGGINAAQHTNDVSLAFHNPALLSKEMDRQLATSFNSFYGGIKNYALQFAYHHSKLATDFSIGTHFLNYGDILQTDASGMEIGSFRPRDFVLQVSAARTYLKKWRYGVSLKWIGSNYGMARANGMAVDVGVLYNDTANGLRIALTAINMGTQFRTYAGLKEELPFDLQLGISKKLADAPLQFSVNLHHLHRFDIRYNDPLFNEEAGEENAGRSGLDGLFRHVVLGAQLFLGEKIELSTGYNHLRRRELNVANTTNGLNGFSMGIGIILEKIQVRYASTWYQNNRAYQQLGLNLPLKSYTKR